MKKVIINRGVPGSGKSTLNNAIKEIASAKGISVVTHSTDDLFMINGEYCFDFTQLGQKHLENFNNFKISLGQRKNLVIVDNTNLRQREYKRYVEEAHGYGYKVIAVVFSHSTLENHIKRNTHDLPEEVLQRMIETLDNNKESIGVDDQFIVDPESLTPFPERMKELAGMIVN